MSSSSSSSAPADGSAAASEDPIRVIARVKPVSASAAGGRAHCVTVAAGGAPALVVGGQTYAFDSVADASATQEAVWELAARGISDNALAGYNGTVFAYGQTGSGKTHTIYGPGLAGEGEQRGVLPRTLDHAFAHMRDAEAKSEGRIAYTCRVSFLEVRVTGVWSAARECLLLLLRAVGVGVQLPARAWCAHDRSQRAAAPY